MANPKGNVQCIAAKVKEGMSVDAAKNSCGEAPPASGKRRSSNRRKRKRVRRGRDLYQ